MKRQVKKAAVAAAHAVPARPLVSVLGTSVLSTPGRRNRLIALTDLNRRLERKPVPFTRKLASGGTYGGRTDDAIDRAVALGGLWEPNITSYVQRHLRAGDTFVDIGANTGYYTILAAPLVGPTGLVVAVEPSPAVFAKLQSNLARNDFPQVDARNVAAGAAPGTLPLYRPVGDTALKSSLVAGNISTELEVEAEVEVVPAADLVPIDRLARVRFVKVDVEGYEPTVVAGLAPILAEMPRTDLILEANPANEDQPVGPMFEVLAGAGFHAYAIPNEYTPITKIITPSAEPAVRLDEPPTAQTDLIFSRTDARTLT